MRDINGFGGKGCELQAETRTPAQVNYGGLEAEGLLCRWSWPVVVGSVWPKDSRLRIYACI